MGYNIHFTGEFKLNKPMSEIDAAELMEFTDTRHGGDSKYVNTPGYWCQWVVTEDRTAIVWDEGEKFYESIKWIEWLLEHFIEVRGYELNGVVKWEGESGDDLGKICITNNNVIAKYAQVTYEDVNELKAEIERLKEEIIEITLLGE